MRYTRRALMRDRLTRRELLQFLAATPGLCQHGSGLAAPADSWKAGLAKVPITPRGPLWLAGYAARTKPSEGTLLELYAKALALDDGSGRPAVLVTSDLLGFPASVSHRITERLREQYQLPRDRVLLNSSHTHGGPVVDRTLRIAYGMTPEDWAAVDNYTRELEDKIVALVGAALRDLRPARLGYRQVEVGFARNRRVKTEKGYVGGANPEGPVDHTVPILEIDGARGELRGVVFGYACHNTTVDPEASAAFYKFQSDYAGFAQAWLESSYPRATALFVEGCGADANPYPRGRLELAREHGEALAVVVDQALNEPVQPIHGPLKTAYEEVRVAFAPPPSPAELAARLQSDNIYERRHAEEMLKILDRDGRLPADYPYPIQVWQFGPDLTFIALAGEVVVDYDLRLKKELGAEKTWVAGYSNDVFAYIPSERVLKEGGYEGGGAMIYYGQPGPFAPGIEETIVQKVHEIVSRLGGTRSRSPQRGPTRRSRRRSS